MSSTLVKNAASNGEKGPVLGDVGLGSFAVARQVGKAEDEEPLTFILDVQLCDDNGTWLWNSEDVLCAVGHPSSVTLGIE